jgi:hypothetical protein
MYVNFINGSVCMTLTRAILLPVVRITVPTKALYLLHSAAGICPIPLLVGLI